MPKKTTKGNEVPHWVVCYYDDGTWWTSGPYSDEMVANDTYNTYTGSYIHCYKRKIMLPLIEEKKRG